MGRAVASDGLRYLARRRGATRAILYVDSSNEAAIQLYRHPGFRTTEHTDRAYRWTAGSLNHGPATRKSGNRPRSPGAALGRGAATALPRGLD